MKNCSSNESSMNISHSNTIYDFDFDLNFDIDLDLDCFNDGVSSYLSSNNGGEGGSFANDHTPTEELLHHHQHYSHAQPTMLTSTPSTSNPNSQFPPPPFTAVTTASSALMESPAVSAAHLVPLSHHHIGGSASSAAVIPPFPLGHSAAQIGASPSSVNYTATNTVCQAPYTPIMLTSTPSTSNPSSQFPPPPFTAVTTASSAQMESPAVSAAHLVPQSHQHTGGSASSLAAAIPPLPLGHSAAQIGASPSSVNFTATNTLCQTPYTVLDINAAKRNENEIGLKLSKSVKKTHSCIKMKMKQKQKHQQWERGSSSSSQAANNDLTCTPVKPLKAICFPALSLEIGTWKKVAIHDDDLVVKCYFRQSQIVWELLDDKLKAKIEVPWSNILAIKPTFSAKDPGILNVMLEEKPSFYKEKNPTPAKHTKWEKSGDFTADSQASLLRVHTFKFDPEVLEKCCNEMQKDSFLKILFSRPYPECNNPHFSDISFGNSFNPSPLPLQPPPCQNPSQLIDMSQHRVHQQLPPRQNPSQFIGMLQQHVHQQPPPRQNPSQFIDISQHFHQQPLPHQYPSQFIDMLQHVHQQPLPYQNPSQFIDMSQHAHQQSEALDYNPIISQSSDNFSNLDLDDPMGEHCVTPRSFPIGTIQVPNTSGNFYHPNQLCANNIDEYQNVVYQSHLATSSSSPVGPPNDQPVTRDSYTEQTGAIISSLPPQDNLVEQQMSPLDFPPPFFNELDHQSNHIDDHQSNDIDDLPDFQDYVRRFRGRNLTRRI